MIAYHLEKKEGPGRHEVILTAETEADVARLMALITLHQHGYLLDALDKGIASINPTGG